MARVGVFFGEHGTTEPGVEVQDPYFGGAGPRRKGCVECGECMTGCRHNAKNTLVKNYLFLAERAGAVVVESTTVTRVTPVNGGYRVETEYSGAWLPRLSRRTFTAEHVVFAAGTWGTQSLLHRLKLDGDLPRISDRLGELTRTTPRRSSAPPPACETAIGSISPAESRSPRRSTPTPTRTSNPCATASAPTRWAS